MNKKEVRSDELVSRRRAPLSRGRERLSRVMLFFEDLIKVPLFRCQHCGECRLSHTAFICSQRCPKRLRNGPCGGTRANGHCEVHPERKCIWLRIYRRAARWRRLSLLLPVDKIHNWELEKTSAWLNMIKGDIEPMVLLVPKEETDDSEGKA